MNKVNLNTKDNKTRIILTVGCVGKTYVDNMFSNVYDFDKHTLDYKYDRTGYEHLSNEEFKHLPNRKIKYDWFDKYMDDWCAIIDSNKYDVVTGWLEPSCIDELLKRGYNIELVLVHPDSDLDVYKNRAIKRGNSEDYWIGLKNYYSKMFMRLFNDKNIKKVWVLKSPIYLSDFLVLTGSNLIYKNQKNIYSYTHMIRTRISNEFNGELSPMYIESYTSLVLTMLEVNIKNNINMPITNRMVHDAWSNAVTNNNYNHTHLVPFNCLNKDVQELDTPYTEKLNNVLQTLLQDIKGIKYYGYTHYLDIRSFY